MNEKPTQGVEFALLCPIDKARCTTMCAAFRAHGEGLNCDLARRSDPSTVGRCTLFDAKMEAFVDESRARGIEIG